MHPSPEPFRVASSAPDQPLRRVVLRALLTILATILCAMPAVAGGPGTPPGSPPAAAAVHPGVPVVVQVRVSDSHVRFIVSGEQAVVLPWLGMEAPLMGVPMFTIAKTDLSPDLDDPVSPLPSALEQELTAAIRSELMPFVSFRVGGEEVDPEVTEVGIPDAFVHATGEPCIGFTFRVPVLEVPQTVGVDWTLYDGVYSRLGAINIPVEGLHLGHYTMGRVTPDEPSWTWHKPAEARVAQKLAAGEMVVEIETLEWTPTTLGPVLALGGLGLLLLVLRKPWWSWGGLLSGAGALAAALWPAGMPDDERKLEIFQQLHQGLYEAFQSSSVDGIYARLEESVTPELLDDTYAEIYESLIMRAEGGARCKIEEYNILTRAVDDSDPFAELGLEVDPVGPVFAVLWDWEVAGRVTHWGHAHNRVNRYKARYEALHTENGWRIHDVEILEHADPKEWDDYGDTPPPDPRGGPAMILDTTPGVQQGGGR